MVTNWPLIELELAGQSKNSLACAIATIAIETASTFEPVREAFWLTEAWRRANLRYYPYYGRGYIQLTWDYNYLSAGQFAGIDLVTNPDKAMEPRTAAKIFAWYWKTRNLQESADKKDWAEVRRRVQGAYAGLDRLTQIVNELLK